MATLLNDRNELLFSAAARVTGASVFISSGTATSLIVPQGATTTTPATITLNATTSGYVAPAYAWSYRFGDTEAFTALTETSNPITVSCNAAFLTAAGTRTVTQYRVQVTETASNIGVNQSEFILSIPILREGQNGINAINNALITLYRRTTVNAAPAVTTAGTSTYTFSNAQIVGQPSDWSQTIPSSVSGPYLWAIQVLAASIGTYYQFANTLWSTPILYTQDGTNGTSGANTALLYAYKRSAIAPLDSPGTVEYSFSTNTITTPSLANSWIKTIPAGANPLYVTLATASSTTSTDTVLLTEWSSPVLLVQDGAAGINTATVYLYARNNNSSTAPVLRRTGTSVYTFSNGQLTGSVPPGWTQTLPAESFGSVIWIVQATAAGTALTDSIENSEWGTPQVLAQKGADGANGTSGTRGSRQLYSNNPAYTNSYTLAPNPAGAASYAVQATNLIATATSGTIPTTPILGDTVTFTNGSTYVYTITYDTQWVTPGTVIDGSLLVTESVTAAKINSNGLSVRDASGNIILSAGADLASSSLNLPGTVNSVPSGWLNSYITATNNLISSPNDYSTVNGWLYGYGSINSTNVVDRTGSSLATRINFTANSYDMHKTISDLITGNTYRVTIWYKLVTATNFVITLNNASSWDTGESKQGTAPGWAQITAKITLTSSNRLNIHLGSHSNTATQQTAGTVDISHIELIDISNIDNTRINVDVNGTLQGIGTGAGTAVSNAITEAKLGKDQWLLLKYDTNTDINSGGTLPTYDVLNKAILSASTLVANTATIFTWGADNYIGVAACTIYSDNAWNWTVAVGHDDTGTIYINGTRVYTYTTNQILTIPAGWCTLELMWAEQVGADYFTLGQAISERSEVKQMWGRRDYSGQTAAAAATATWASVSGTGRPEDNATLGAQSGVNLKDSSGTVIKDDAFKNNLINVDWWKRDAVIPWSLNGEFNRIVSTGPTGGADLLLSGPRGGNDLVWYSQEVSNDGDSGGGWNADISSRLDSGKTYRFAVAIRVGNNTGGNAWWGTHNVCDLNTTNANTNPYFAVYNRDLMSTDRWYLFVGFVFPYGSTGNANDSAGVWDCKTGAKVGSGTNWCHTIAGANVHRAYQYYTSPNAIQFFSRPTINMVDGTEPGLREYFEESAVLNSAVTTSTIGALAANTASTLSATVSVNAVTGAGFRAGSLTWDAAGNRTGGSGVAMTPGGLVGHNGTKTTFAVNAITGDANYSGSVSGSQFTTGAFIDFAWPASNNYGTYLGPNGLRIGNVNNNQYLEVTPEGKISAPGLSIQNGTAIFSGTLSAAIVSTDQIAGNAASVAYSTTGTGASLTLVVSCPANTSVLILEYYLGTPATYNTGTGSKDDPLSSGTAGPYLSSLTMDNVATTRVIISPQAGNRTIVATRTTYSPGSSWRLSAVVLKR